MRYRLLGTLEVHHHGAPVPLGGPRQRAVFAALLIRAGRVATIDYLARAAWDRPPASMRANLRTYVTRLRRALTGPGQQGIISHPDGYELLVRPEEFDLAVFEERRAHGLRAELDHDFPAAARHYARALSTWRGRALEGVRACGPALRAQAAVLEERRLATVERAIEVRLLVGAPARVIPDLYRLVAAHPVREVFWSQLMRGLHAAGRRAEALGVYRRACAFFLDELGVEPGRALRRVHRDILDGTLRGEPAHVLCASARRW